MKHQTDYFKYLVKMKSFLNLANAEKISKHKKNGIYVQQAQEYEKIIGTIEAEAVTEKEKMREKFLKTDASV